MLSSTGTEGSNPCPSAITVTQDQSVGEKSAGLVRVMARSIAFCACSSLSMIAGGHDDPPADRSASALLRRDGPRSGDDVHRRMRISPCRQGKIADSMKSPGGLARARTASKASHAVTRASPCTTFAISEAAPSGEPGAASVFEARSQGGKEAKPTPNLGVRGRADQPSRVGARAPARRHLGANAGARSVGSAGTARGAEVEGTARSDPPSVRLAGDSMVSAIDLSGHPRKLPTRRSTTRGVGGKRGGKLANGPAYFLAVDFFGGAVFFREAPFGVDGLRTSLTALPAWNRTALLAAIWMASPVCGFRPSRADRAATLKIPSPETRTSSPATRASRMAFATAFTAWPATAWLSSVA